MKSPWILVTVAFAIVSLTFASLWYAENGRASALDARASALDRQITDLKAENAKLSADAVKAKERADALEVESAQLRVAVSNAPPRPAATTEPDPKQSANPLASLFKNPRMRKIMAASQASVLRGMYSDFLKQAHLTPDETEKFFQLLQDRQSGMTDASINMMSGSGVNMSAATAATSTADDALKTLLGPDLYIQYQNYQKTLAPRMELQQFNQQLTGEGMPLQDYQNSALIQIIAQESLAMPNFDNSSGQQQLANMSEDDINALTQQFDAIDQRIYNRAMSVLTPPQLSAFATYQKNLEAAQVAGIKMAQQMMKGQQ